MAKLVIHFFFFFLDRGEESTQSSRLFNSHNPKYNNVTFYLIDKDVLTIIYKPLYIIHFGAVGIKPSHHPHFIQSIVLHYDSVHMQSLREALEIKFLTKLCSL